MWVALFRSGFTVAEIAKEFGLSRQSIYNAINRLLIDKDDTGAQDRSGPSAARPRRPRP